MQWSGVQQKKKRHDYSNKDWIPEPELSGSVPRTIRSNRKLVLLRRAVVALIAVTLAGYVWPLVERNLVLSQGMTGEAVVEELYTQYTTQNRGYFTMYFIEISYTVNGNPYRQSRQVSMSYYFDYSEGDTVPISYLLARPSWVALQDDTLVTKWTVLAVAALLFFVLWGLNSSLKEIVRLLATGHAVKGVIVDISGGKTRRTRAHIYYEYDKAPYSVAVEINRPEWKTLLRKGKVITLLVDPKHKTGSLFGQRLVAYPYVRGFEVV